MKKNIRILKMPLWLFILLCVILTFLIVIGIIVLITIIEFKKPVETNPVIMDVKVESVEITKESEQVVLDIGDTYQIEYTVYPVDAINKNVTFASSDESIITVSKTGLCIALASGVASIQITTQDGNYTDSLVFVIKFDYAPTTPDYTEIFDQTISEVNFSINMVNDTIDLDFNDSLIVTYPNNDDVIINWNISNPNILYISSNASNGIELLPLSTGQVILTLSITYENETITKDYYINITDNIIITNTITNINLIGINDYYEGDIVNTNDIKLMITYSDGTIIIKSLYEYDNNITIDTNLANCECLDGNYAIKYLIFDYYDELGNIYNINKEYKVYKVCAVDIIVTGVNEYYLVGEEVNIISILVKLNNGKDINIDLSDTINNITEIDMNIISDKELIIEYLCKQVTISFKVVSVVYRIVGLNNSYKVNDAIDYSNVHLEKIIDNESTIIYLKDIYNETQLNNLIDTSFSHEINFSINYDNNEYTFGKILIKEDVLTLVSVINLNDDYYIHDEINANNLIFRFQNEDNEYLDLNVNDVTLDKEFSTNVVGENTITLTYLGKDYNISYNVKYYKLDGYSLVNFNKYYLLNESVNLNNSYVTLICNDATFSTNINYYDASLQMDSVNTSEYGEYTSTIIISKDYFENDLVISYTYIVCNPLKVSTDSFSSFSSTFNFYVNIDKNYYRDDYDLFINNNSSFTVNYINKNGDGNFEVSVTLSEGKSKANVTCALKGSNSKVTINIRKIQITDSDLNISIIGGNGYSLTSKNVTLEVICTYNGVSLNNSDYNELTFTWSGISYSLIDNNPRRIIFTSEVACEYTIKCKVSDGTKTKEVSTKYTFCDNPITNLGFTIGSKSYGIGKEYVLASKYLQNPLTQSNPKVNTYTFDVFGSREIDLSKLVFYVSEEDKEIANFNNNVLSVYGDGYVTLYVTTIDAINLGYTDSKYIGIYIGSWKVKCIGNSLYVTNYLQLKFAFDNGYKVVLDSSIMVGPEVMDIEVDKTTGVVTRTLKSNYSSLTAIATLNSYLYKIDSTWNTKYIENIALINNKTPDIKLNVVCNVTTDIYGNGYTIDLSQYTTLSQAITNTTVPFFNGPLKFLEALSIVRVYGQDDIGFLVHDNVTIDNVTLQNCDSGYLKVNGKLDYSRLNKVGSVVEVYGDNVTIKNSRLLNGRNIIRAYGSSDVNQKIHATIDNCIISNAREYLIKIGTNKSIHTDTVMKYQGEVTKVTELYTTYGMKMDKVSKNVLKGVEGNESLLFSSTSPFLTKANGDNYIPLDYNNLNDDYFVSNYLMTDITLKNSVLEDCGFFAICLESQFSGPVLGGYQYAPKDIDLGLGGFDYKGIYDINATSYASVLRLVGDVRIYNWKNIDDFDSSTIMEQINNAQALLKLVGEDTKFEFDIKEILSNVAPTDPTIIANNNGNTYAHGGIIFYGGGKNYDILDTSSYTGYELTTHNVSMNQMGNSTFVKCIPWVAGREPFRFVMYDSTSQLSYDLQESLYANNEAYSNLK